MNKASLTAAVAEKAGIDKKVADKAVKAVFDSIEETLKAGDKVQLVGFGTFSVRERAEKQARNLATGETITVPAAKVPGFKAGQGLKDAVAGK